MNKIIINRGSFRLNEVVFEQGTTTIGRAESNTIPLDDTAVSSHHAKIVTLFHTSYIEDLDSTNGTLVNGKPVQKHTLHSGDVIALGNHQLLFQSDNGAQKTSETSETMLLHGSEIKQRLNEFIQAQTDLDQQRNKAKPAAANNAPAADISEPVKIPEVSAGNNPPAFGANQSVKNPSQDSPSLDREKNRAWLDARKTPVADEKPSTGVANKVKMPPERKQASPAPETEPQPSPHHIRNTAAAIRENVNTPAPAAIAATTQPAKKPSDTMTAQSTKAPITSPSSPTAIPTPLPTKPAATEPKPSPENSVVDIAAAARAATQRSRRSGDSDYAASNGAMAVNRDKPRGKIMPVIWLLIVAVLLAEVIYITFRSLG